MISIFISYRRKDASQLAHRIKTQLIPYGIDAYVDVYGVQGAGEFPQRLMKAIADASVFVCLLGPTTLESEWVVKEIRYAFLLDKPMIPVFLQEFVIPAHLIDPAVLKLLDFDNVEMFDIKNLYIDPAIEKLASMIQLTVITVIKEDSAQTADTVVETPVEPDSKAQDELPPEEPVEIPVEKTPEQDAGGQVEIQPEGAAEKPAPAGSPGINPYHPNNDVTRKKRRIGDLTVIAVLVFLVIAILAALRVPKIGPGVPMVLVPAGCFQMGSVTGYDDERPVHEVCLESFWIDKTEVTQGQFREHGGVKASANAFVGDNRPVESITWFEARDFCALRGGRLPTEEEWEYAARGPENLDYPWGDELVDANAVFARDDESGTAEVGSLPDGASWVGALDMSGNVWEWTATEYVEYDEDGYVEEGEPTSSSAIVQRVLRGGSWHDTTTDYLRGSLRFWREADLSEAISGFRCVRDEA